MVRRGIVVMVTLSLVLGLAVPALAAEEWGSLRVILQGGEGAAGNSVMVYQVGEETEGGYRLTEEFRGGIVWQEDALSDRLAWWLAGMDVEPAPVHWADEQGCAVFEDLPRGLYLILQIEGSDYSFLPCLVTIPYEGSLQVTADLNTWQRSGSIPKTGQHPAPFLGAAGMVLSGIGLALCAGRRKKE